MNRLMTDEARPFWGSPPKDVQRWLSSTKPAAHGDDVPPLLRHAEVAARGAKPIWQIFGNGTVGSQSIVGIPALGRLKAARGEAIRIWPFETGWKALSEADLDGVEVLAAEVYPALVKPELQPGGHQGFGAGPRALPAFRPHGTKRAVWLQRLGLQRTWRLTW